VRRSVQTAMIAAVVFCVSLIAGGGAMAQWSDDEAIEAPVVVSGDLDVALVGTLAWWDLSDDVAGTPLSVGADFLTVPGDVVAADQGFTAEAVGDNMAAELNVTVPGLTNVSGTVAGDVDVTYSLFDSAGTLLVGPVASGTPSTVALGAEDTYRLRVVFTWQPGALDRVRVNEQASIDSVAVALRQVRP
jgi:alternate signal-mediated exported protein